MNVFTQKALNVTGFSLSIIASGCMSTLDSVLGNAPRVDCLYNQCHVTKWAHSSYITFLLRDFNHSFQ
jgi:hypothetical protein